MSEQTSPKTPSLSRHHKWVGIIAANWAVLEASVDGSIWKLAKVKMDRGACITANLKSINLKLDSYIALAHLRGASKKTLSKLNAFRQAVYGTGEKRNRAVHDPWVSDPKLGGDVFQVTITARRKPELRMHPVPIEDLIDTNKEIVRRVKRFYELRDAVTADISTSK